MIPRRYKILFFGTPDFAVPVLETLFSLPEIELTGVFTQPDKPVGRKQALTPPPVKVTAREKGLKIWQPEKLKTKEIEEQLKSLSPDVCMVVAYGKIIPKNLLAIPKFGWLNVHGSLLPKYRGASPIQAAILHGDTKTGVTLMQIDHGLDTGNMIIKKEIKIESTDNFQSLHDKLSALGAEIIKDSLFDYLEGKLRPQPQDSALATETKIINKEDGQIDWKRPAVEIERQIRAYTPWPGAFCFWNNKRIIIINARMAESRDKLPAGQTKRIKDNLIVGCGSDNLELKVIQMEGKKSMAAADFLKGNPNFEKTQLI